MFSDGFTDVCNTGADLPPDKVGKVGEEGSRTDKRWLRTLEAHWKRINADPLTRPVKRVFHMKKMSFNFSLFA